MISQNWSHVYIQQETLYNNLSHFETCECQQPLTEEFEGIIKHIYRQNNIISPEHNAKYGA